MADKPHHPKKFQHVFFLIFLGLGSSAAAYSLWSCYLAHQAKQWPSVSGIVMMDTCRSTGGRTSQRYTQYQYRVGGSSYVNHRNNFGLGIATNNCIANLKSGQSISVYYDPANPSNSVLTSGDYHQSLFGLVVGLVFAAFAIVGLYFNAEGQSSVPAGRGKSQRWPSI